MGGGLTEEGDVVGSFRDAVGDVEEEDAKGKKNDDSNLNFLTWRTKED